MSLFDKYKINKLIIYSQMKVTISINNENRIRMIEES